MHKQEYEYTYIFKFKQIYAEIYTYIYTGNKMIIVEKSGHFENGIPIPDYKIHLVLDQILYNL